jgi:hypothetical protein
VHLLLQSSQQVGIVSLQDVHQLEIVAHLGQLRVAKLVNAT